MIVTWYTDDLVSEVEMPLPLFFRSADRTSPTVAPRPEGEGLQRTASLSRRLSFRKRRREARSSDKSTGEGGVVKDKRE